MPDRLDELLARWRDRLLTDGEQEELVRLLESPKARRRLYEEFAFGYGVLEALREARAERSERRLASWTERTLTPRVLRRLAAAAAVFVLALVVARLLPRGGGEADVPPPVAVLEQIRGTVHVAARSGTSPAEEGQGLRPGQGVVTRGPRSGATLRFADGTTVDLGGETMIYRVQQSSRPAPAGRSLFLALGSLSARVAPQPSGAPMVVDTPHARMTVRGTRFTLGVDGAASRLEVREGRVEMAREGRRVDVSAGRFAVAGDPPPPPVRPVAPGVDDAIRRGCEWFLAREDDLSRPFHWKGLPHAYDGLVLLALAHGGVDPDREPRMRALLDGLLARRAVSTYDAAMQAMALQAVDPVTHYRRLETLARRLEAAQCANGQWGYRLPGPRAPAGENSTAQYALLGLRACRDAGISIDPAVVRRARAWWRASRNDDGGWGYADGGDPRRTDDRGPGDVGNASYGSMTAGAAAALLICGDLLGEGAHHDPVVRGGLDWIAARFDVTRNPGKRRCADLFYLYALERLADLGGWELIGGRDWYAEASSHLLAKQLPDGHWDLNTRFSEWGIGDTAFAILVLRRATAPARSPAIAMGELDD